MAANFDDLDDDLDWDTLPAVSKQTRGATAATESGAQAGPSSLPERGNTGPSPVPLPDAPDPSGEVIPLEAYADDANRETASFNWHADQDRMIAAENEWPDPLDLSQSLYHGLPLNIGLLPRGIQPLVSDASRRTGIDPAPIAFGLLAAIAGLSNDFIRLQPKLNDHTWTVHPVIWPFVVGGPSSGKSPAMEEGMRYVQRMDRAAVLENTRLMKDYEHEMNIYEQACAVAVKEKAPRPVEPEKPRLREYWVSRGTIEGITRLLEFTPKVTYFADEFSSVISNMDRYAAGGKGSGDREFFLQAWNGGPGKTVLAGRSISIENASIVICGGTTPVSIKACAGKLQNDGFLQRTMMAIVPNMKQGTDTVPDSAAYETFELILKSLTEMHGSATLVMSPDASGIYQEFCATIRMMVTAEENESMSAHLGKWPGLAARLMLIWFLTERASYGQTVSSGMQIPAEIASQCCSFLLDWQLSHVQHFYYEIMGSKEDRDFARLIFNYLLAHEELDQIKLRDDIMQPHWRTWSKLLPWQRKEAVNTLVNTAILTPMGSKRNGEGLPTAFMVNPKLRTMFVEQREREKTLRSMTREGLQKMRNAGREPGEEG